MRSSFERSVDSVVCTVSRCVGAVKASDLIIFNIIMKPVITDKALPHTFVTFLIGAISGVAFSKEGGTPPWAAKFHLHSI